MRKVAGKKVIRSKQRSRQVAEKKVVRFKHRSRKVAGKKSSQVQAQVKACDRQVTVVGPGRGQGRQKAKQI